MLQNHAPRGHETNWLSRPDGIRLRFGLFPAPAASATVLIVTGRSEYIEKYHETAADLGQAGYACAVLDLRGQGGSTRITADQRAGHVNRFSDYTEDLKAFIDQVRKAGLPAPFFLMGHSLGGLIALSAAAQLQHKLAGLILCAPFTGLAGRQLPAAALRPIARALAMIGFAARPVGRHEEPPGFAQQSLTSDQDRYQRNMEAARGTNYILGAPTFGWVAEALGQIARITRPHALSRIELPVLLLSAGRDTIIPPATQRRIARQIKTCRLVEIPGAGHEILQERDPLRAKAITAIVDFLGENLNR
ncbi:alpha/beta hydrolase [Martelella sp. HB161492]|uniref:alpha/beta fold hydrolase n=1 Tax=Martelella sp. HB161492 TaxID=2720726 RepID=UPI00159244D2|nr:alpha/beta hydrolase [Martelella sp. HB161492]